MQIVSGLSEKVTQSNYASTDHIKSLESWKNYFIFGADVLMFTLPDGSLSICLLKAMVLCQETQAMFENQLILSHQFERHLKQYSQQNSERLLRTLADEKVG